MEVSGARTPVSTQSLCPGIVHTIQYISCLEFSHFWLGIKICSSICHLMLIAHYRFYKKMGCFPP